MTLWAASPRERSWTGIRIFSSSRTVKENLVQNERVGSAYCLVELYAFHRRELYSESYFDGSRLLRGIWQELGRYHQAETTVNNFNSSFTEAMELF